MDEPIRGRTRELATPINIDFITKIHNRFDVEVINSKTGKIKQKAYAENVICSQWWTDTFAGTSRIVNIGYGSGTGTPSSSDTDFFTRISYASTGTITTEISLPNRVLSERVSIQLSETTAVGKTITEVGLVDQNGKLVTHAMLKDMNGNQISIAKTNTDIVNIYATVFLHWAETFYTGEIKLGAGPSRIPYFLDMLIRGSGWKPGGASFAYNRGVTVAATVSCASLTTDIASKKCVAVFNRLAAGSGNLEKGIKNIIIRDQYAGYSMFSIDVGGVIIPPTVITGEAVGTGDGTTKDFATAFDCPSNATIYIDGVADTTAVVDNVPLLNTNMGAYFEDVVFVDGVMYPTIESSCSTYDGQYYYYGRITKDEVYYNPYWEYGIVNTQDQFYDCSDDGVTWVTPAVAVEAAYQHYRYWRLNSNVYQHYSSKLTAGTLTGKNIHFATAPASGAVITADYTTPRLGKDANHVFDLTVTITLGEYTA